MCHPEAFFDHEQVFPKLRSVLNFYDRIQRASTELNRTLNTELTHGPLAYGPRTAHST